MTSNRSRRSSRRSGRRQPQKSSPVLWIVLAVVLVAALAVGAFFLFGDALFGEKEYYDPAAVSGTYHDNGYTDPITTGALYPLVNETITVDAAGKALLGFENVAANPYDLQLVLLLEGETIYSSGAIKPGSYIESATLDEVPAAGSYTVIARFIAYDAATQKAIGKVDYPTTVTLTVG